MTLSMIGQQLIFKKQHERAFEYLTQVLNSGNQQNPASILAKFGMVFKKNGADFYAITCFEMLVHGVEGRPPIDPNNILSRVTLASLYRQNREYAKAAACIEPIVMGDKPLKLEDYKAWEFLGKIYMNLGKKQEARDCFRLHVHYGPQPTQPTNQP
jgi:tetratricopeptide (TPR) repeat protein